jgi:hypothetical protein
MSRGTFISISFQLSVVVPQQVILWFNVQTCGSYYCPSGLGWASDLYWALIMEEMEGKNYKLNLRRF